MVLDVYRELFVRLVKIFLDGVDYAEICLMYHIESYIRLAHPDFLQECLYLGGGCSYGEFEHLLAPHLERNVHFLFRYIGGRHQCPLLPDF